MRLLPLSALLGLVCTVGGLNAQAPAQPNRGPVYAQLLKSISVRHLQPGSSVFARVSADWTGLSCSLRKGAIIEARVEAAVPRAKGGRGSELALSFSKAQCSGAEMAPLDLVLAGVAYVATQQDNSSQFGVVSYMSNPIQGMGPEANRATEMASLARAAAQTIFTDNHGLRPGSQSGGGRELHVGDVYGIRGVTMQVGAGPHRSSLLTAAKRDIALDEDTVFLLLPAAMVFPVAKPLPVAGTAAMEAPGTGARVSSAAAAAAEDFEPCAPPSCSTDLPAATEQLSGHPVETIGIERLGYAPRPQKVLTELDHDDAMAWLGPDRLLVAFNPHKLIYRNGVSTADAPVRMIRAVLLDTAGKRVVSTASWELSDFGDYLWQIAGNRMLVHAGDELRVYDAELQAVARLPLTGRLDFVRISPNGEVVAVGVVKERHTPELHAKLRENLQHEPQEDVEVLILDKNFKTLAQASTTSDIVPPTLLNEGKLTLFAQSNHRYRLTMLSWEGRTTTLARFSSACMPQLSTLAPDLVFVRSCEKAYGVPEIRVLRANGQVVMHGRPDVGELGYEAKGDAAGNTFAVKVLHTLAPIAAGADFHGSDLNTVELRVYRATDGKRLSAVRREAPTASHDGYCLSPDGRQIAVLAGGQVSIFPVPAD